MYNECVSIEIGGELVDVDIDVDIEDVVQGWRFHDTGMHLLFDYLETENGINGAMYNQLWAKIGNAWDSQRGGR